MNKRLQNVKRELVEAAKEKRDAGGSGETQTDTLQSALLIIPR
jgi:hypothetical protein